MRVCCLGSGPSLTQEAVESCRPFFTIAINNTWERAPWANILYAGDYQWWMRHDGVPAFTGIKMSMSVQSFGSRYPDVIKWRSSGVYGLDTTDGPTIRTGKNSGYQAINVAVKHGATEIILHGYDMQPSGDRHHWHDPHHDGDPHPNYAKCLTAFETLVEPLRRLGVTVINASPDSALNCFPKVPWPQLSRVA